MSNFPNMRGAVDLSAIAKPPADASMSASPAAPPPAQTPDIQVNEAGQFLLPGFVLSADQDSLRAYLAISAHVPIVVDFYTTRSGGSAQLSAKLAAEVNRRNGAVLMLRIDGDANHAVLQAFKVESLPAVAGLLKSQPVPLFAGDQTEEAIATVLDKMLEVAKDNGIVGSIASTGEQQLEPELPPQHAAAYEAMEQGDFAGAAKLFEKILAESPADVWAAAGLAQAKLLNRTDGIDLDQAVDAEVTSTATAIARSDAHAVCGEFDEAFTVLLDRFATETKDERETLRQHLLELFQVATNEHPAVAKARLRLANLLY